MSDHQYNKDRHKPPSSSGPATGSNATFMCKCCGIAKLAAGRRRVDNVFYCAACVKEAEIATIRVKFEAWMRSIGKSDLRRSSASHVTDNDYTWGDVNDRWEAWRAALGVTCGY